ncbi:pyridoxal phosphate-dependent aminotransferase [Halarsenatibacter silvermanii]|uniref:Aminotransferase n=1 Tax=Halarsenatibacter silvermanii TaxID=321763 RepID=A0A1G9J4A4_9FIRM|nr:pyridoxal phosphate-dependent aminotransferase [Halarsenatibacter silvermanii]SDL32171.1 Aspartate/methionine/tyrosine aminotransferase [Halarsenatibacter silvermanii]
MKFSPRMKNLKSEKAFDVLEEVNSLREEGKDVISLAIGEPDFNTPENVKRAGIKAIEANKTGYSPSPGITELREEAAKYFSASREVSFSAENAIIAPGAKPLIFYGLLAMMGPDSEAAYPSPGFPVYESIIELFEGKPVPYSLPAEEGFDIDPDEIRSKTNEKTDVLIINSPHNPTGSVISKESLVELAEIAEEYDYWIISDEVYFELSYGGDVDSIASLPGMKERTLIIDSFSKTYAMTGWRIGFGAGPRQLIDKIGKLITNSVSCTATFTQHAAVEALRSGGQFRQKMVDELKERRDLVYRELNKVEGIECQKPEGAFYAYADVTEACELLGLENAAEFQKFLLHEAGVAVLYRECFGSRFSDEEEEYIRISFANSQENISRAINRIRKKVAENSKGILSRSSRR